MIVVVVDPHPDRGPAGALTVVNPRVQALFGKDSLVTLDFPVVARRVGAGALMP